MTAPSVLVVTLVVASAFGLSWIAWGCVMDLWNCICPKCDLRRAKYWANR